MTGETVCSCEVCDCVIQENVKKWYLISVKVHELVVTGETVCKCKVCDCVTQENVKNAIYYLLRCMN